MIKRAEVAIINCCETDNIWEVARIDDGALWHFGTYETFERAEAVAEELGEGAIVARLID